MSNHSIPPPFTGIVVWDIIITIATGTVAATFITWLSNWAIKKREEYIDVSKYKIDGISSSKPYFTKIAKYYRSLSWQLSTGLKNGVDKIDRVACLFYISNILFIHREITEKFGELQLDNLHAEE